MITYQEHLNLLISFTLHTWFDVLKKLNLWTQLHFLDGLNMILILNQMVWILDFSTG